MSTSRRLPGRGSSERAKAWRQKTGNSMEAVCLEHNEWGRGGWAWMPQWGFYLFKVSWGVTGGLCTEQWANGVLFLKTQWLLCWEQVDRHRQKQKGEWEAVPVNPGREGRSLDQAVEGGDSEEHRYSGSIREQKKHKTGFAEGFTVWYERKNKVKCDFKVFNLSNWEDKPGG